MYRRSKDENEEEEEVEKRNEIGGFDKFIFHCQSVVKKVFESVDSVVGTFKY